MSTVEQSSDDAPTAPARGESGEADLLAGHEVAPRPSPALDRHVHAEEHAANVLRMRRVLPFGYLLWASAGGIDWMVQRYIDGGDLRFNWAVRAVHLLVGAAVVARLHAPRPPGPRLLRALDLVTFCGAAVAIALQVARTAGLSSYAGYGVACLVVARGITLPERWSRGLLYGSLPVMLFFASPFVLRPWFPGVTAQLADPHAVGVYLHNLVLVLIDLSLVVVGGHVTWSLRRELFESRRVGRYTLVRKLGGGLRTEVWRAQHQALKRDVALKILRPVEESDDASVARFEREAQAASQLEHPNAVRLYDFGVTDDGLWYYVMELLDGEPLEALIARDGRLSPGRALVLMQQAASALAEAHGRGIIHRDLKPGHLFVSVRPGEPDFLKVLDFGLARIGVPALPAPADAGGDEVTRTGSPGFMAPEQAAGRPADARSDVYALGAIFYYALTAQVPLCGPAGKPEARPIPPSLAAGRPLPPLLDAILMRCLEVDPARRYQSAAQLAGAVATCPSD
jgi:serine/threonine-protein kinase